jgi:hypothetical protein
MSVIAPWCVCDNPDQAAHYYILDLEVGSVISDPALG